MLVAIVREVEAPAAWHDAHTETGKLIVVPHDGVGGGREALDGTFCQLDPVLALYGFVNRFRHISSQRLDGSRRHGTTRLNATNRTAIALLTAWTTWTAFRLYILRTLSSWDLS